MAKHGKRRQQPPPTSPPQAPQLSGTPSLAELERFSDLGLRQWRHGWECHRELYAELYFGVEAQRARYAAELADALRSNACAPCLIDGWGRIVDYQYSLAPLSVAGSLSTEGGRFNVGGRLNPSSFTAFPALYIADSLETAYAEKFAIRRGEVREGLSADEIALRRPGSFTFAQLRGRVEFCFDIGDANSLRAFVGIISKFKLPEKARQIAKSMRLLPPTMIRSVPMLRDHLLHVEWNTLPIHFDLPSNSQIFGRMLAAAGFHGVLYPSARETGGQCLALFPQNWRGSTSMLEVCDASPDGARLTRLDGNTGEFE
ncbi:MAG: RES family NAD+ phosphorylase [Gammaproteobacteria bacterium]